MAAGDPIRVTSYPSTAKHGNTIVVEGTGPATSVDATYHGDPLDVGDVTVDDTGKWSITFTCPAPTGPGPDLIQIDFTGGQGGSASVTIEVLST